MIKLGHSGDGIGGRDKEGGGGGRNRCMRCCRKGEHWTGLEWTTLYIAHILPKRIVGGCELFTSQVELVMGTREGCKG